MELKFFLNQHSRNQVICRYAHNNFDSISVYCRIYFPLKNTPFMGEGGHKENIIVLYDFPLCPPFFYSTGKYLLRRGNNVRR